MKLRALYSALDAAVPTPRFRFAWSVAALTVALAASGCSSVNSAMDSVFGPDEADAASDEPGTTTANGLNAPTERPEYADTGARRKPTTVRALPGSEASETETVATPKSSVQATPDSNNAAQTVAETAAVPEKPQSEPLPLPEPSQNVSSQAAPAMDQQVGSVGTEAPPLSAMPEPTPVMPTYAAMVPPPVMTGTPSGTIDDFGTTVISGSGQVVEQSSVQYASAGATDPSGAVTVYDDALGGIPQGVSSSAPRGSLVATIQFARGSSSLSAADQAILRQVIALQRQQGGRIYVVGHASSYTGNMSVDRHKLANLAISSERASRIADALRRYGAPLGTVEVSAVSDSDPVYHEVMPSGEAGNRRAEIYLEN